MIGMTFTHAIGWDSHGLPDPWQLNVQCSEIIE